MGVLVVSVLEVSLLKEREVKLPALGHASWLWQNKAWSVLISTALAACSLGLTVLCLCCLTDKQGPWNEVELQNP